jgi:hypothetical protein
VCRADSAAFRVVVPADSVSGFRGCRHCSVAANDVRKMLLLAEVPAGLGGAPVVVAAVVVLAAEVALGVVCLVAVVAPVVVLVEVVNVAAVEAAVALSCNGKRNFFPCLRLRVVDPVPELFLVPVVVKVALWWHGRFSEGNIDWL